MEFFPKEIYGIILSFLDTPTFISFCLVDKHHENMIKKMSTKKSSKVRLIDLAAKKGYLGIIQWIFPGTELSKDTCSLAAAGGYLEVLKWARDHDCLWDSSTCSSAALGGHLEVLKWARENGCKWDDYTCSSAARGGH